MKPPGAIETSPAALERLAELERVLGGAIRGKPEILRLSLVCLLSKGHLLIEDVPGRRQNYAGSCNSQIGSV